MFEPFCGLSGNPFEPKPDPAFFFASRAHRRVYRRLEYGLRHGGLTLLTGEAGVGKTTTVEALLRHLDVTAIAARTLDCGRVHGADLLRVAAETFGDDGPAAGRRRLLILDAAQMLPEGSWRHLHRLPFPVFLVGRPKLRERVMSCCHLQPLEADETPRYIEHRLRRVGWKGEPRFDKDAFALIHSHTGGIPGQINLLCARALAGIFVAEKGLVDAETLRRALQAA